MVRRSSGRPDWAPAAGAEPAPADQIVRLRGHHLLCLLTYVGRGYTAEFVANFDLLATALSDGVRRIRIVDGPDDICRPVENCPDSHCHEPRVKRRDAAALVDIGRILGCDLLPGADIELDRDRIARLRAAFAEGSARSACQGCQWHRICSDVADSGFDGTRFCPGR
ncbi:DUF1284 domain-containing protein [Fodinicurvata sp. EGI_FJ10296]|uniref:DUF1284 domain-containing protein n=1 Tax=Fodinicurvata sp. EGI_FJ10296 TaxID=3231908 RepID=UPI003451EE28